jgi:hypothetical protein
MCVLDQVTKPLDFNIMILFLTQLYYMIFLGIDIF